MMTCKKCGNEVQDNWRYCPYCGEMIPKKIICASCQELLDPKWKMCPNCGLKVGEGAPKLTDDAVPFANNNVDDDLAILLGLSRIEVEKATEAEARDAALKKARIFCMTERYAEAESIYDDIIDNAPDNINAYIGKVRVASVNFTKYEGEEIEKRIMFAERIAADYDDGELDPEYTKYIECREKFFECERKRLEEEEKAKEKKRKLEAMGFYVTDGVLTRYEGTGLYVEIPDGVTSIGNNAFFERRGLTTVVIPDGVTSIGNGAFWECISLQSITIPDSVTSIGENVFWKCGSLRSITIPDSVTSIGNCAFDECSGLTSIKIPDGITVINRAAFCGCRNLTSVTLPKCITRIGDYAFYCCSCLSNIFYAGTRAEWGAIPKGDRWHDHAGNFVIHCSDGRYN